MSITRTDKIADNQIDNKIDRQIEVVFTSSGPIPLIDPYLSVFNDDGSLFNYYDGLTNVTVSSMGVYDCYPVGLSGGSTVTSLSFVYCGDINFLISDTSSLTALTNLSFNSCGSFNGFSLSDTSGLTSLTSLSFYFCGYVFFSLPDTSGLTSLTSLSFNVCGFFGIFSLPTTSGAVGTLDSLTNLTITNCGVVDEAQILLILQALDAAGNSDGTITITDASGTSTLGTVISNLEGKGWTISIT